jgi:hypothetical protein
MTYFFKNIETLLDTWRDICSSYERSMREHFDFYLNSYIYQSLMIYKNAFCNSPGGAMNRTSGIAGSVIS